MATVLCQGLQSCLESQLVEPRATLRLKLSSPMPHYSQPLDFLALKSYFSEPNTKDQQEKFNFEQDYSINKQPNNVNDTSCDWSFLKALFNISQSPRVEKESTYVHPLFKSSKSTLSEKSLKLCTEDLGNETGTDIIESSIFSVSSFSSTSMGSISKEENDKQKQRKVLLEAKKAKPMYNFPPPLTTIRGIDCLQVKAHREEGRLVMKAIKNPSKPSSFLAERSHGRLRLTILESSAFGFDLEETTITVEENGGDIKVNNEKEGYENDIKDLEEEEEEEEESKEVECWNKDLDGNSKSLE